MPDGRGDPPAATASTPPPAPSSALPRTAAPPTATHTPTAAAGPSSGPPFAAITLHAADPANLRSGARIIECPTCVGGSRVGYIGGPNTLAIRVAGVATAGERTLTVTYETAETRTLRVAVDDGPAQRPDAQRRRRLAHPRHRVAARAPARRHQLDPVLQRPRDRPPTSTTMCQLPTSADAAQNVPAVLHFAFWTMQFFTRWPCAALSQAKNESPWIDEAMPEASVNPSACRGSGRR